MSSDPYGKQGGKKIQRQNDMITVSGLIVD